MIEIIRFVKERGPEYEYRLNLGKCLYLLSPNPSDRLSATEVGSKERRRAEWG